MRDYRITAVGDNVCDKCLSRGRMYPEGQRVNTYVYAKLNGAYTVYLGKYGTDQTTGCVRDILKQIGIDDSYDRCYEGENKFALVALKGNDRVFLGSNKGGAAKGYGYDFTEEDFVYISQFSLIYTSLNSCIEDDLKSPKETGVAIAYDFSTRWTDVYLEKVCLCVTVTIFSCAHLTRQEQETGMKRVQPHGVKVVLDTIGEDGPCILYDNGFLYVPAVHVGSVTDTMGVDDSYLAALLYSLLETLQAGAVVEGTEECMRKRLVEVTERGAVFAVKVCTKEGAFDYGVPVLRRTGIWEPGVSDMYHT